MDYPHDLYNKKRTKKEQAKEIIPTKKRRVNITIDGRLWDKLDELSPQSKSKFVEDFIKKELEKNGLL